jgi:uncharacterized membrane protein YhaH (DUF805 family)
MSFWDIIWFIIVSFAFVAYLMVLFSILTDLFRDRDTNGFVKALWIIFLIFVPFLTALIYLIARGGGMAERSMAAVRDQEAYIQRVASAGDPTAQIARAQELLASGTISQAEFDTIKAKALA